MSGDHCTVNEAMKNGAQSIVLNRHQQSLVRPNANSAADTAKNTAPAVAGANGANGSATRAFVSG